MAEQPSESKCDESNENNTNGRAADILAARRSEAVGSQRQGGIKAGGGEDCEAGAAGREDRGGSAGAGSVQAVQAGLGGDCRADSERARHAVCVPILPEVAPRSGARTGIQEDAARTMEPLAPSGGIRNRWHAH
ncbi:MAG: hypothetical protein WB543_05685 [Candidatus Acidiferrum sp.]